LADFLRALPAAVNDVLDDIAHPHRTDTERPSSIPRLSPNR
jgi:hypothetical protein